MCCATCPQIDTRRAAQSDGAVVARVESAFVKQILLQQWHVLKRLHMPRVLTLELYSLFLSSTLHETYQSWSSVRMKRMLGLVAATSCATEATRAKRVDFIVVALDGET